MLKGMQARLQLRQVFRDMERRVHGIQQDKGWKIRAAEAKECRYGNGS